MGEAMDRIASLEKRMSNYESDLQGKVNYESEFIAESKRKIQSLEKRFDELVGRLGTQSELLVKARAEIGLCEGEPNSIDVRILRIAQAATNQKADLTRLDHRLDSHEAQVRTLEEEHHLHDEESEKRFVTGWLAEAMQEMGLEDRLKEFIPITEIHRLVGAMGNGALAHTDEKVRQIMGKVGEIASRIGKNELDIHNIMRAGNDESPERMVGADRGKSNRADLTLELKEAIRSLDEIRAGMSEMVVYWNQSKVLKLQNNLSVLRSRLAMVQSKL